MSKILKVRNVGDYIQNLGGEVTHPLVGVVDYATLSPIPHSLNNYSVYGIFMHQHMPVDLVYGCGKYDYKNGGTIICVAPGQIGGKEDNGERINLDGWSLLFHPDLLHGTALEKAITKYSFFDYNTNEALHTTQEEYQILVSLMRRIDAELKMRRDEVQDAIIIDYISLVLNYCNRFYDRQFTTRKIVNADILNRFHAVLDDYYTQNLQLQHGLVSVSYCADKLCMSPSYLGDLIKKHTGESAISYIHQLVIRKSKNLLASGESVASAAYELGFEYPGHFSRLFKKEEGVSPTEYLRHIKNSGTI